MNVTVRFPKHLQPDIEKAKVATSLCQAAFLYIDLPDNIIVEFIDLGHNAYGESTLTFNKESKVRINLQLSAKEMIYPLVHELLHLNQIHEGKLSVTRFGDCVWEGKIYKLNQSKMSYKEYTQLPWELDVTSREQQLLANILQ
jgi:hypothetical protein